MYYIYNSTMNGSHISVLVMQCRVRNASEQYEFFSYRENQLCILYQYVTIKQ